MDPSTISISDQRPRFSGHTERRRGSGLHGATQRPDYG